ncbi:MAG: dienelactone hydrolase family protein [Thermoanaerobaculales bacterium]|jgi:carboxymethylenebutenolidase|nr:dienelactone hydrolase family protein [Thermoanaerobaculales bacterium]
MTVPNDPEQPRAIPLEAFSWYDEYAHGMISRRELVERLSTLGVLGFSVAGLTSVLMPDYALAEQVSFNDPDIRAEYRDFPSPDGHGEGRGYLVVPSGLGGPTATVLVVHENRGLNPYIEDVARRVAKAGFIAFAPDALHPVGGYPGNDDDGRALQRSLDPAKIEQDFIAAARFVRNHPSGNRRLGVVGFCFGGYIANLLAATLPDLVSAAAPFYGTPPAPEIRSKIRGPLLIHLAELDQRVNETWPGYEADLRRAGARFEMHMYPGVQHGFHNDSTPRYDEAAAELAWRRTLDFFRQHLATEVEASPAETR